MKNKKTELSSILFAVAAILFYISAILAFFSKEKSTVVMNICLGTTFLALAAVYNKKNNSDTNPKAKDGADEENTESEDR